MNPSEQQALQDRLADLAETAKTYVRGGDNYRATIILRATHLPDGDVVVTDDTDDKINAALARRFGTPSSSLPSSQGVHPAVSPAAQSEETLRVMHAKKQGAADGFQAGWHAALARIKMGDGANELGALCPEFPYRQCAKCDDPEHEHGDHGFRDHEFVLFVGHCGACGDRVGAAEMCRACERKYAETAASSPAGAGWQPEAVELAKRVTCNEHAMGILCVPCHAEGRGCLRACAAANDWPLPPAPVVEHT